MKSFPLIKEGAAGLRTAVFVEDAEPVSKVLLHALAEGEVVAFGVASFFEGGEEGRDRQFVQIE